MTNGRQRSQSSLLKSIEGRTPRTRAAGSAWPQRYGAGPGPCDRRTGGGNHLGASGSEPLSGGSLPPWSGPCPWRLLSCAGSKAPSFWGTCAGVFCQVLGEACRDWGDSWCWPWPGWSPHLWPRSHTDQLGNPERLIAVTAMASSLKYARRISE